MCGIAGYCSLEVNFRRTLLKEQKQVIDMGKMLNHRGPNDFGIHVDDHVAFAHTRLAVIDIKGGKQPMKKTLDGYTYVIVYNGEIYNTEELRQELLRKGIIFSTSSDTEVVLSAYMVYGKKMVEKLNGIYSFVIWDERERSLFFCRDRLGVKPLFYTMGNRKFYFASEIKALLAHPDIKPKVSAYGLCQLFGIGPARVPGSGVYEEIYEVLPGHCGTFSDSGLEQWKYWEPEAKVCTDTYEQAVEKVRELLTDSITRQLVSDVPICTLLSGGLDSSVVSAVAADYLKKQGKTLDTYSFDYTDNNENFKSSAFQPEQDRPYVEQMVAHIGSNHHYLECAYSDLYDSLFEAVRAKDMPGMTDVDASLLYFARKIKEKHTVCLSGECADEIFGGYPWFRAKESFQIDRFPWSRDLEFRMSVVNPSLVKHLPIEKYVRAQYLRSIKKMSCLPTEKIDRKKIFQRNAQADTNQDIIENNHKCDENYSVSREDGLEYQRRQRELAHLNIAWFMATLLERKDRMTMASGLEVRVPFADHRLVEYLYQLPWDYKYHKNQVKSLLKDAMGSYLPKSVLERKKCPYPKSYDPKFENLLKEKLHEILKDTDAPIQTLVNKAYLEKLMASTSDHGKPWFGQLMATPQMYAYLIQMNYWLEEYQVDLRI